MASRIQPLKPVEDAVFGAIDDRAEVKDSASPDLRKIRKQMVRVREDILARMTRILQDSGFQKVVQEPVITVRDDRYVLPLKPNFRQSLQGIVHGHSGSRATLFIEPLDLVEQNNRLAEIRMEEREEVERILRELTALLSQELISIEATITALTEIDAVSARAEFGLEYRAIVPELSRERRMDLRGARHPLLVGKAKASGTDIVPNDIILDSGQRAMILSGPNAGGKTVILKTMGLLCLMAQSGLPITAAEGSELPCFSSIFADIGDDLSTFSSHAGRIAEILREAGRDSLVLLDELGSGTDPGEGASLGAAVLESLIDRGCVTVVTTHHNALKLFGSETSGAVNAAMEFDPRTLKPTYRIIPGRPGRSYGLDMACRIGIPDDVITKARARINDDDLRLDKLLKQVEDDSRILTSQREALEHQLITAKRDRTEAESALRDARNEAREVRAKARAESKEVVAALKQKLSELSRIATLDQAEIKRAGTEVDAISSKLRTVPVTDAPVAPALYRNLQRGDRVRIVGLNRTGVVIDCSRDVLELDIAGKKVKVSATEVASAEGGSDLRPDFPSGWSTDLSSEEGAADQLNVIGLRVVEAIAEIERFIDRAILYHLSMVTIIHGLGTGALKTAVTDVLKNHPLIASIRAGEPSQGGAGVTIAELKR
jgi:DNA mismatch repair protein MutS2